MPSPLQPGKTVGIDLGTTRSCIAHIDNGKAVVIPNADAELVTPSVVLFDEDGTVLVGNEAKAQAVAAGDRVVRESKREIGRSDASWDMDGVTYTPEMVGSLVLKKLKQDAEGHLGEPIVNAVITVPAYFTDSQRAATEMAGKLAGLNVIDIFNEPMAAALAYGMGNSQVDGHVLVYDLGGGTFDVTVMKLSGGEFTMVASDGDVELGGADWDQAIVDYVRQQFIAEHGDDPTNDLDTAQAVKNDAETAKELLSRKDRTKIIVQHAGNKLAVDLSREQFEEMTEDLLARTSSTVEEVIENQAGLTWADIDRVLLVGGSSKMPQVSAMMSELAGRAVGLGEVEPDLGVAQGAAWRALMLEAAVPASQQSATCQENLALLPPRAAGTIREGGVTMVTTHAYGVKTVNERGDDFENSLMIGKNEALPVSQTRTFGTASHHQTSIEITVIEGEEVDLAYCEEVGTGEITGLPPLPQGSPVTITMTFNAQGIIEVYAREDTYGRDLQMKLERRYGMSDEEARAVGKQLAGLEVQ